MDVPISYVLVYAENMPVKESWRIMARIGSPPEDPIDLQRHGFNQAYEGNNPLAFGSKKRAISVLLSIIRPNIDFTPGTLGKDGEFVPSALRVRLAPRSGS